MTDVRRAVRVLLLDEHDRVLLLFGRDSSLPADPGWWFTPGGGVEGAETSVEAAIREVFEETGMRLPAVSGPVGHRDTTFTFEGTEIHQVETYFSASVDAFEIERTGWTELERRSVLGARWWAVHELETTTDTVYPENIVEFIRTATSHP